MPRITTLAFDADDTLWQSEQFFRLTQQRFTDLLRDYSDAPDLEERLLAASARNLRFYGFGAKSFSLSMIEAALEVTDHRVPGTVIAELLAAGRELLSFDVETLPYVDQALSRLRETYRLILVTKGDLFDQERKLAASGLAEHFAAVEILSDKTTAAYARIFERHTEGAGHTVMIGNSLRSDIVPALDAGAFAIYVPHDLTWSYEHADEPVDNARYARIPHLGDIDPILSRFEAMP